jgi:ribosome-associated translation inhibitor RaiA
MAVPVQVTYGVVAQSNALDALIQKEAAKLERFFRRIVMCRVLIDKPHRHHTRGAPFHVRIELSVPGEDIVISHTPEIRHVLTDEDSSRVEKSSQEDPSYKDVQIAIRDAFRKARRQLQDYADRKKPHKTAHQPPRPEPIG